MAKMFPKKLDEDFVNLLLKENEGLKLEYKQQISSKERLPKRFQPCQIRPEE
jgi:hypothetical protein